MRQICLSRTRDEDPSEELNPGSYSWPQAVWNGLADSRFLISSITSLAALSGGIRDGRKVLE